MINQARYRQDYDGEFVITETRWAAGKKEQTREWVPNPIENQHISGRAACIVPSFDHELFDYTILNQHRGGLLGSKKLQTYGTGIIAQQMKLDFTVETDYSLLHKLIESQYQEKNIVYTTSRGCINNPGEFYLIPYNPVIALEALPLYLAAFDGHKEIFMIGYNKETHTGSSSFANHVGNVIHSYPEITFTLIGKEPGMYKNWLELPNTRLFKNYRELISYCDI